MTRKVWGEPTIDHNLWECSTYLTSFLPIEEKIGTAVHRRVHTSGLSCIAIWGQCSPLRVKRVYLT